MTPAQQVARNAAADLAYHHTGNSSGRPDWWLLPRPEPAKATRPLAYTVVDAAHTLGLDLDPEVEHDPGDWGTLIERPDWRSDGQCHGLTPLFFPESKDNVDQQAHVCQACPVQAECLAYAVNTGEQFGVWGGLSVKRRTAIRSRLLATGDVTLSGSQLRRRLVPT